MTGPSSTRSTAGSANAAIQFPEPRTGLRLGGEWSLVAFPVFTPEREAELRKKAESNPVEN